VEIERIRKGLGKRTGKGDTQRINARMKSKYVRGDSELEIMNEKGSGETG